MINAANRAQVSGAPRDPWAVLRKQRYLITPSYLDATAKESALGRMQVDLPEGIREIEDKIRNVLALLSFPHQFERLHDSNQ